MREIEVGIRIDVHGGILFFGTRAGALNEQVRPLWEEVATPCCRCYDTT
jgi:hypothetical protein